MYYFITLRFNVSGCVLQKRQTNLGQQREIVQFIGREMPEEEGGVPIHKLDRKPNVKLISTAMKECILLQLCTEMEIPAFSPQDAVIFTGKASRTKRKNKFARSWDAVQYLSSQNEVKYTCKNYKPRTVTHLEMHVYLLE